MRDNPYEVLLVLAAGFFYILFAGAYAFFYTLGNMKNEDKYKYIAFAFAGGMHALLRLHPHHQRHL